MEYLSVEVPLNQDLQQIPRRVNRSRKERTTHRNPGHSHHHPHILPLPRLENEAASTSKKDHPLWTLEIHDPNGSDQVASTPLIQVSQNWRSSFHLWRVRTDLE